MSFAAGTLLTVAFLDLLPEAVEALEEARGEHAIDGASLMVLVGFLLVTIFLALMTVIPKLHGFRPKKHSVHDPTYSPLYFDDYADIPYDEYAQNMEEIMNDSNRTYETMVKEIYYSGVYLVKNKYKYIRSGYMFFFAGLIVSTLIYFIVNLM